MKSTGEFKHPPTLKVFFATEMWERYGFYVVQTLLALYLAFYFQWDDTRVYYLVGAFTALTYLTPLIGGWIADQLLGQKLCIISGACILCVSYLILGLVTSTQGLLFALAGIGVGTGLLKPNISSLLGNEYPATSPNREVGFTIFYMGLTTGIILGTTLPSYIQTLFGWPTVFISATLGTLIAVATFVFGVRYYGIKDYTPYQRTITDSLLAIIIMAGVWLGSFYILQNHNLSDVLFVTIGIASLVFLVVAIINDTGNQKKLTLVTGLLCIISVMFWAFYFQMFQSLTLLIKRIVEPQLFGINFPPPYYVAVQSFGLIIFGMFMRSKKKKLELAEYATWVSNKFFIAVLLMTLAYLLIDLICYFNMNSSLFLAPLYFIPAYLIISLAELLLSPVGLSAMTLLSHPNRVSTMMGVFFVSLGFGGFLSGKLANLTAISPEQLQTMNLVAQKNHYFHGFFKLFIISCVATICCFVINRIIKYIMIHK